MATNVVRLEARPSDGSLVLASRQGDMAAKEMLFRRHLKLATGLACRLIGGDDDDVDDIVQESFTTAFAKLASLKQPQAFASWLGSIVTTTSVATLRRRRLLRWFGLRRAESIHAEELISADAPADVMIELRAVYEVIQRLPVDLRVMLILKRVEELTLEQIAEQTGWSVATIKRRLARAEKRLDDHLAGRKGGA